MCFLPCLCLHLHVYVIFVMLVLRSTCLCAFFHACAQIYMFMCFLLSLYVWIYMFMFLKLCLDAMPSVLQFYISCLCLFLVFGFWVGCRSRSSGLGLHPYTHVSIKGFDQFLYACLCFVCSFPCFLLQIHACLLRSRLFVMFLLVFSLWVCYLLAFGVHLLVWLHPPLWWLIWMQLYLGAHLHDVWACLPLAFFLFYLALHVRGSLVSLLVFLITCLPFPFM